MSPVNWFAVIRMPSTIRPGSWGLVVFISMGFALAGATDVVADGAMITKAGPAVTAMAPLQPAAAGA